MRYLLVVIFALVLGTANAQIGPPAFPPMNGLPGQPAGPLDNGGRVPSAQSPASAFDYKGDWNATANSPDLANGIGTAGDVYLITTGGTQNLGGGDVVYVVGSLLVYDGSVWDQVGAGNIPVPATPTASVGTSSIAGVASTYMRSDGAPALNLTIAPTWTGLHDFAAGAGFSDGSVAFPSISFTSNPGTGIRHQDSTIGDPRISFSIDGMEKMFLQGGGLFLPDIGLTAIGQIGSSVGFEVDAGGNIGFSARLDITAPNDGDFRFSQSVNSNPRSANTLRTTNDVVEIRNDAGLAVVRGAAPVGATDLATKAYVDNAVGGGAAVYGGRCNATGESVIVPTGWSCSKVGTGIYNVNVPGSINANNLPIVVSISGNWVGMIQAYSPSTTSYRVSIVSPAGAPMDASFGFVAINNP